MPFKPQAFIFDAYGTLFDVHSVVQREQANIHGDLQALSQLWRQKQLEYTWLRALMAVSYTHLDVYKRQPMWSRLPEPRLED